MTLAVYISGHGFGHASREVEILNAFGDHLGSALPSILIRSAVDPTLLARTMTVPYTLLPGPCDTGVVQATSVSQDDERTFARAVAFYRDSWPNLVEAEATMLAEAGAALVVSDIAPLGVAAAACAGVPSMAIANFTWDWIYDGDPRFGTEAPDVLATIRAAYAKASLALRLPFSPAFDAFPHVESIPLVARRASHARAGTRAHFNLPADRPVALLSFGGYGLPDLDLARLDCRDRWTIVVTDRVQEARANTLPPGVRFVPEREFLETSYRYEDLVAACDVVVTKPGYGIIAECVANDVAMLYTSRGRFREYDLLVAEMPRYLRCRFLPQDDLFAGRLNDALDRTVALPPAPLRMETTGADVAAARIAAALSTARS